MSKLLETIRAVRDGTLKFPASPKVWHQPVLTDKQWSNLLKRVETEVSGEASRAVQMYIPVYEKEAAFWLFCGPCANHYGLNGLEKDNCGRIMAQFGMLEVEHWDDKDWMFVVDRFPDCVTVNGKELHESSKVCWSVCSPNRAVAMLHAKWNEQYGLAIIREDVERFEGTNIVLRKGPCEK
jgi:hypothetical protein